MDREAERTAVDQRPAHGEDGESEPCSEGQCAERRAKAVECTERFPRGAKRPPETGREVQAVRDVRGGDVRIITSAPHADSLPFPVELSFRVRRRDMDARTESHFLADAPRVWYDNKVSRKENARLSRVPHQHHAPRTRTRSGAVPGQRGRGPGICSARKTEKGTFDIGFYRNEGPA